MALSLKILSFLFLLSRSACLAQPSLSPVSLHYLGGYEIPFNQQFKGTTVGGLSGIDYDPANDLYYLISDDRSAINPARFYTARIFLNTKGIDSVKLGEVHYLKQSDGHPYPGIKQNPAKAPDPEAIRYNLVLKKLVWTSEGERNLKATPPVMTNPSITTIDLNGKHIDEFPLASHLSMQQGENGPRQNGTLEGLTFSDNYKVMYVSLEEPLHEDGARADLHENNAWVRLYKYDVATKKNVAQYAYRLEPVAYAPFPEKSFMVNGITDILALGSNKLLIIERSFSTGRLPCTVKVFIADLSTADNILATPSLLKAPPTRPAAKKLLLNMDDLGIYIDNIEGVTFGPTLPNGHKTLILDRKSVV